MLTEDDAPPAVDERRLGPPPGPVSASGRPTLIAETRLDELRALAPAGLDFGRLIRLCGELNTAYNSGCYLATIMLTRCLLDHVPPAFGMRTFKEVVNNYGGAGKSFSGAMRRLDDAARNIADSNLHMPMRGKESLPGPEQVNFSQQLDVLLAEIVRITPPR